MAISCPAWTSDQELIALARRELYSAVLGDILDSLGRRHQFLPPQIQPLRDDFIVCGRAMPVLEADDGGGEGPGRVNERLNGPFGLMLRALDDLQPDEVYVCTGASPNYALWGELMSMCARNRGAAGAVVDGWSRDTRGILAIDFPCFSFGRYAQDQRPRGKVIDFRCTIQIGAVQVRPGDLIFGDIDGVVVVPREIETEVIRAAWEKAHGEKRVFNAIKGGMGAQEAWDKFGISDEAEPPPSHHRMKIIDVKVWLVEGVKYNWTLLKIYTDTGHTGVGEATNWPGSPIIEAAARHAGERVIGLDPMRTDFIWTKLYRDLNWIGPNGASLCAISGLDMALLDLKAKVLGVPLYQLLGGAFRTEILLYANYWFTGGGHTPEDYARQAARVVAAGFTGLKFDPFAHTNYLYGTDLSTDLTLSLEQQQRAVAVTRAVRDAIGPGADLMIETHAMLNGRMAIKMAEALAPCGMTWYEEPTGPENAANLRALRERLPGDVSICVGERHYTRHGFRPVFEANICDIVMPDITRCGGPSEMKRIATMAEAYNVLVAPHNPNGPLSTLASAHLCASIPNFFRCEYMFNDVPWRDAVLTHPLEVREGRLHLSDRPGLGVDLVEEEIARHPGVRELNARANFYV